MHTNATLFARALSVPERLNLRSHVLPVLPYMILRLCRMTHITFSPAVVDPTPQLQGQVCVAQGGSPPAGRLQRKERGE